MTELDLFLSALGIPLGSTRIAFLDEVCAGDPDLRRRVDELFAAHAAGALSLGSSSAGQFSKAEYAPGPSVADSAVTSGAARLPPSEDHDPNATLVNLPEPAPGPWPEAGSLIAGRYLLVRPLGEGGMGSVWLADQIAPVKRQVAVKLIKAGMDSTRVIARFEAERQALALMDHPHIARVLDGGTTPEGRPFFVMEVVKGTPVTTYCDEHLLPIAQRLELFVLVCAAVQHAHQKGIMHRDLKPSNVLVAEEDGKPVPKVIDFGLAKALQAGAIPDASLETGFGSLLGTPLYMAPEQADPSTADVDTRADVYALGVLLYELLTGTTPIQRATIHKAALGEVWRVIREIDPPTPSKRLAGADDSPSIAAVRGTNPAHLAREVRGDLEWVTMKCLEKDRGRRYETVNALSADIRRHLADEPVLAGRPGRWYKARKFIRRNRGPVVAAALVAMALVTGVVGTTLGLVEARRQRDGAEVARKKETEQRKLAEAARVQADEEAAIAKAGNDFLLNDLLAEAAPEKNPRNANVTVEELLGRAAARISGKFGKQPRVEAAVRLTIGDTYHRLGNYPAAQPHLEKALEILRRVAGSDHPDSLNAMDELAGLYKDQGRLPEAQALIVAAVAGRRQVLGEDHPDTLSSMNSLAAQYWSESRFAEAESLDLKVLADRRRVLGEDHPDTLRTMNNLAGVYLAQGRLPEAEPLYLQSLAGRRRVLGEDHPETLSAISNLAVIYHGRGRYAEAEPLFEKALEIRLRVLGEDHPKTIQAMGSLAVLYQAQDRLDEAGPLFEKALSLHREILGEDHPDTLYYQYKLASYFQAQGLLPKAEPLLRDVLRKSRARDGSVSLPTANALAYLGSNLLDQKKYDEATPIFRECLAVRVDKAPEIWTTFLTRSMLGGSLLGEGKLVEAEPLLLAGYEGMKARKKAIAPIQMSRLAESTDRLIALYVALDKPDEAAKWQVERGEYPPPKVPMPREVKP